jgi:hypothetical protein
MEGGGGVDAIMPGIAAAHAQFALLYFSFFFLAMRFLSLILQIGQLIYTYVDIFSSVVWWW